MRREITEVRRSCEHEGCGCTLNVPVTIYQCDKCGGEISREDHFERYAHELNITLDQDECVNFLRRRDYCPACLEPVWRAINELIGADPDAERDREYTLY